MNEINHSELIAKRIQELIEEKNLTINRLSVLANLTQSTVNSIYNGKSKTPTLKTIYQICTALDISVTEFLNFTPYNKTNSLEEESTIEIMKEVKKLSAELQLLENKLLEKME